MSSDEQPLGSLGRRFNRRSPFYIGLTASAGVAVTYGMVRVLASLSSMLVLIGVALFLAIGWNRQPRGSSTAGFVGGWPRRLCSSSFSGRWAPSWLPRSPRSPSKPGT
jgi:hypothetical protein